METYFNSLKAASEEVLKVLPYTVWHEPTETIFVKGSGSPPSQSKRRALRKKRKRNK